MEYAAGDRVAGYEVLEKIGVGGMGSVYRVRNVLTDRMEAMKVLLPGVRSSPELGERFLREIKIQASLTHPNIAGLFSALPLGDDVLMFMELVEGRSLERLLARGALTIEAGASCMCQVLDALEYAHSCGVVHRDVKPSNIMLRPDGAVKLTDFGIASRADRRLTRTGTAIGSLHYMAPEQISAGTVDARSDVYSAGITLYETLTGRRPFEGETDYAIMAAHLQTPPPAPADLPPGLTAVILRAIEKSPEARFQNAREFHDALAQFAPGSQPFPAAHAHGMAAGAPAPMTPTPTPASPVQSPDLDRVKTKLAEYIGPVARILVDRAAKRSASAEQVIAAVAAEIPDARDRERFLKAVRAAR